MGWMTFKHIPSFPYTIFWRWHTWRVRFMWGCHQSWNKGARVFIHTVDGRNPAPPWMIETLINNGINHLSTGARFLPSTVSLKSWTKNGEENAEHWVLDHCNDTCEPFGFEFWATVSVAGMGDHTCGIYGQTSCYHVSYPCQFLVMPTWLSEITLVDPPINTSDLHLIGHTVYPISIDLHPLIFGWNSKKKAKSHIYLIFWTNLLASWSYIGRCGQASSFLMIGCCDMLALPNQARCGVSFGRSNYGFRHWGAWNFGAKRINTDNKPRTFWDSLFFLGKDRMFKLHGGQGKFTPVKYPIRILYVLLHILYILYISNIHISSCVHHIGYITYPSSPALQADAWRLSLRRTCRPVRWNSMRPWGVIHGDPQWRFSTENCNSNWSHNEHRGLGHNIQDLIFLHSWLVHRFG